MINASMLSHEDGTNIITMTQSSGCSIVVTIARDVNEDDWDEFTLLFENFGDTLQAVLGTTEEEGLSVRMGNNASILVEHVEEFPEDE